ncbi:FXYD domain-containing ion transport regulator 3-like [Dromaius novaehollandiae]|uniref:FXYD domain-containing ion transport regulator 3-like n=1 Tax=Dromaius novaehollandiae TaxID=8790 RepID=UPI00311EFAF4
MAGAALGGLLLLAALPPAAANPPPPDVPNPFYYDWHRLRVGGLVVAAVLCVLGVIVLFSSKCKCGSKGSHRHRPPPEMSHLVTAGAASTC